MDLTMLLEIRSHSISIVDESIQSRTYLVHDTTRSPSLNLWVQTLNPNSKPWGFDLVHYITISKDCFKGKDLINKI